jgi:hypothetical protein
MWGREGDSDGGSTWRGRVKFFPIGVNSANNQTAGVASCIYKKVALLNAPVDNSKSLHQDLNQWSSEYQASTLPTELCQMIQYGWKSKYNYWLKLAAAAGATLARPHILKVASPQCPMNVQKYQFSRFCMAGGWSKGDICHRRFYNLVN